MTQLSSFQRNQKQKQKYRKKQHFSLVSSNLQERLENAMQDSANLKTDTSNLQQENMQQSNIPIQNLPPPNIPTTTDMPQLTTVTKRPRQKNENQTPRPKNSTHTSASSETSEEELDPLTPKQEKIRKRYEGMYAGIGAGVFGFSPYSGMVLMQSASVRSEELIRAARHNPVVWHWVEYFANSSDTFNLVVGHGVMLWAIMAHMGRIKGNPAIFQMAGLSEAQIMQPPPNMPEMTQEQMNAYTKQTSHNGNRQV